MDKKEVKRKRCIDWPLGGLFIFVFLSLVASMSILFSALTRGGLVVRAPLVDQQKAEAKYTRAFLWKDEETPYAVIIDNMKDAWPPKGLEYARIVFEAPVEAGITRFLAIFGSDEESDFEIGPVRSARPYFVDWAEEFGTLLAHVGGSPEALEKLKASRKIYGLDEFRYRNPYFIRSREHYAPHNTFTSLELLKKFYKKMSSRGRNSDRSDSLVHNFNQWKTKESRTFSDEKVRDTTFLSIAYPDPYDVRWEYDKAANNYLRVIQEKPFLTAAGFEVRASNVVVLKTDITIIDNISRRKIVTNGSGEALIFQDGKVTRGRWKKEDDYTKFYTSDGSEVVFNTGPVWIEVVNDNLRIDY